MRSTDLVGCNLSGMNLTHAYLRRAFLKGANLTGADLPFAHLKPSPLERHDLPDGTKSDNERGTCAHLRSIAF